MSAERNTSRNQRKLALRNANLRPPLIQRNVTPKADQPSSNILAEINNASLRRRQHQRQAVTEPIEIYQDPCQSTRYNIVPDGLSNNKENQASPEYAGHLSAEYVGLSPPSPIPPVTSRLDVPRIRSPKLPKARTASGNYRMHIEHLEAQLVAAQGQLEDYSSPKSRKAHSARRRALSQECELLRHELSDVEERCQRRIDEEAEEYKACIKRLEREVELSEQRRMEAEYDLEETKKTLKSVQASHIELERRLDSWSGLLARSPSKVEVSTPSPIKPRPKSMFPRIPTRGNLQEVSPSKSQAPSTPVSPSKYPLSNLESSSQRPVLPKTQPSGLSLRPLTQTSPLPYAESVSIKQRRQLRREEIKDEEDQKEMLDQCLSDELGLLGLADVFTKHSQTTGSTPTSPSHYENAPSAESQSSSPCSPLAYKSDLPSSKPPRVMRRFVNTAGGPKALVLSATLKHEQKITEAHGPARYIIIRLLKRVSNRVVEACSAPFVAARWCLALFLLGPLAWRRVLAGPTMIYGS